MFLKFATYNFSNSALKHAEKINPGTVAYQSHQMAFNEAEPLLLAMDCLYKYALTYKRRFGSNLADDGVLGQEWLDAIKGIHGLLNGDGEIAMAKNISTDSKDNGAIEGIFLDAIEVAGFSESDL